MSIAPLAAPCRSPHCLSRVCHHTACLVSVTPLPVSCLSVEAAITSAINTSRVVTVERERRSAPEAVRYPAELISVKWSLVIPLPLMSRPGTCYGESMTCADLRSCCVCLGVCVCVCMCVTSVLDRFLPVIIKLILQNYPEINYSIDTLYVG